jgi:hypothetical protein
MRKISYADAINETRHQMIEKDMVTGGAEFIEEIEWKMSSERAERRILFVCPKPFCKQKRFRKNASQKLFCKQKPLLKNASQSSFIQNNLDILKKHFDVRVAQYRGKKRMLKFLIATVKGVLWADVTFSWFADVHALNKQNYYVCPHKE